jgi:hypothetical protein
MDNEYGNRKAAEEERRERRNVTLVKRNNSRWRVVLESERPLNYLPW